MDEKKTYVCGFCGKEYDTPQERAACEMKCYDDKLAHEKALKEYKLREERNKRLTEIQESVDKTNELIKAYENDYNENYFHKRSSLLDLLYYL